MNDPSSQTTAPRAPRGPAARQPSVLIADDHADVRQALQLLLKRHYQLTSADSPAAIVEAVAARHFDLLLMDMNYAADTTSGQEGVTLLDRLQRLDADLPIVVMTAWGSVEGAVAAIKAGARDYVEKPWDNDRLLRTLENHIATARAVSTGQRLTTERRREREKLLPPLIAESRAMKQVVQLLDTFADSDANVLVTGEHGCGKEVVARWLHARSSRAEQAFVPVDAGALVDGVFESELFGHVRGAFTDARQDRPGCFEVADGGTLFLDEIGNMPRTQQAKLLRVLQTGEVKRVGASCVRSVDTRVISATNAELQTENFRQDLVYRLNTLHLHIPPLRERRDDILPLALHTLERLALRYRKAGLAFSPAAMRCLGSHAWPGNVRELEHAVERAVIVCRSEAIEPPDLALAADNPSRPELMSLPDLERWAISEAMKSEDGNVERAAKRLGLSRSALYRRLQAPEAPDSERQGTP